MSDAILEATDDNVFSRAYRLSGASWRARLAIWLMVLAIQLHAASVTRITIGIAKKEGWLHPSSIRPRNRRRIGPLTHSLN